MKFLRGIFGHSIHKQAVDHGVVVGRDNLGSIFTGNIGNITIESLHTPHGNEQQIDNVAERVTIAARELITAARKVLQFSSTVVPVGLDIVPNETDLPHIPTNLNEVFEKASSGENLLLFGEGGIGKTTSALELAQRMLDAEPCQSRSTS